MVNRETTNARALLDTARSGDVRFVVRTRPNTDPLPAMRAARAGGAQLKVQSHPLRAFSLQVPKARAAMVRRSLEARADVVSVTEAHRRYTTEIPDDAQWASQVDYMQTLGAPAAWDRTHGDAAVKIAIIDTGVDVTQPDLSGKIAGTYDAVTGGTDVSDAVGHGTMVASVPAASTDDGYGIAGAGHDSSILAVKVADANGDIWSDVTADGIRWAADHGARVINLSLGSNQSDPLEQDAVAYARGRGAVVVAAAGNDGVATPSYPAADAGVVAVGATDHTGTERAYFSNYGSWVDVGAPGMAIAASGVGGTSETVDGTSFSSPLVAGEAALLVALNPQATEPQLVDQLTRSAGAQSLGFAGGTVRFDLAVQAAVAYASPPTITAPASGATVSGVLAATASSPAQQVRFSLSGGPAVTAPVHDGVSTAGLDTLGLAGPHTLMASNCPGAGWCAPTGASLAVTVANPQAKLTAPTNNILVTGDTVTASATAVGGSVRFLVDGVGAARDAVAPYSVVLPVSKLPDGAHKITAQQCNSSGNACDTATVSTARTINVRRLHPTLTISPSSFSPNGDRRQDTTTVSYRLDQTQSVVLRVRNAAGSTVLSRSLGTLTAATRSLVWNGKTAAGALLPNGTYTVTLTSTRAVTGGTLHGLATGTVRLDRTAPALSSIAASNAVYPVPDGYYDSTRLKVSVGEPVVLLDAQIRNSAGTLVRTVSGGSRSATGATYVTWNGRSSSGAILPSGTYSFSFLAQDRAGNRRVTPRYSVALSTKRIAWRTGSATTGAFASAGTPLIGDCSEVVHPGRPDWSDSLGYYSNYDGCSVYQGDDLAAVNHHYTLPSSSLGYGSIRVDAYGANAAPGYPDVAVLLYRDKAGNTSSDVGKVLGAAEGTYLGPTVNASSYVNGRTVSWVTGTTDDNWYDVKWYRVTWTYRVLV